MQFFAALARDAKPCLGEFNATVFARAVWAFAKADQLKLKLFAALARAARPRLGAFNAQDFAKSAWAFATTAQLDMDVVAV